MCIGSATSEAPRAFSSGWPSKSADVQARSGVIRDGQHACKVGLLRIAFRPELLPAKTYHLDLATGEEVFLE
jgi:hypothetical protein